MSNWNSISKFVNFTTKGITPSYVKHSSIIVLNQKCIRNNKIDYSFSQYTDDTKNISSDKFLKKGDILVNSTGTGTAGRCAFVAEVPENYKLIVDSHILILRCNSFFEAQCLSYVLYSFEKTLMSFMTGSSGQSELDKVVLLGLKTKMTENFQDQQKIASVLSTLDAKIELNNKINTELEAMAKTLYDYWFVQFDFPCLPENYKFSGASKPANFESVLTYTQVGGLPLPDGKKWFVYVILCEDGSFYKGITNDLYRRYYEHKTGQGAEWTKTHKPKKIIHYEEFETQNEAAEREKELKTGYGRTWLQREYDKFLAAKENNLPAPKDGDGSPAPRFACKLRMAGKMVWSAELKRDIPKGWEVKSLSQIESNIVTGKTPSTKITEYFNGDVPFICIGDVRGNMHIVKTELTLSKQGADTQKNKYIPKGAICVTCIASPGLVGFATDESQTNQQLNSVVCKKIENRYYLYFYLIDYFTYAKAKTGNTFANMNKEDFSSILVLKPSHKSLINFSEKVKPLIERILINSQENQKLTKLRDFLLPMLMNGQVVVN